MTDWASLSDACGTANHVPALLDRFEAAPAETWSELMDHLCPQLEDAYSASFAALPRLAKLAQRDQANRSLVLLATGAIVACARVPCSPEDVDVFGRYPDAIAVLHHLTDAQLPLERDPAEYTTLLQALLSFEAVVLWDRLLNDFADREYLVACPVCWVDVFVYIGSEGNVSSCFDLPRHDTERFPLLPATAENLTGLAKRVYGRVLADDQPSLADALLYLSGHAMCPDCRHVFRLADELSPGWL